MRIQRTFRDVCGGVGWGDEARGQQMRGVKGNARDLWMNG